MLLLQVGEDAGKTCLGRQTRDPLRSVDSHYSQTEVVDVWQEFHQLQAHR